MHDHQQHSSKMMWIMMLGCAVPLVITAFAGQGKKLTLVWVLLAFGGMLLLHWIAMRFMHKGGKEQSSSDNAKPKDELSRDDDHPSCH